MALGSLRILMTAWVFSALGISGSVMPSAALAADIPIVFAAASLKNALDDIHAAWQKGTGKSARISYGASSALAKQIENGGPAEIFISADIAWMDHVEKLDLVRSGSRANLLSNSIVLIARRDSKVAVKIAPGFDLAGALGRGRLAMANTHAVPAGKYGRAALEALGAWDKVRNRVAQADNARAALLLVSRGEAPLGIVYKTDAAADPNVKIVDTFPATTRPPIVYPAALMKSAGATATEFLAYVRSPAAKPMFEKQGFVLGVD